MQSNIYLQDEWLQKLFSEKTLQDFYLTDGTALSNYYFGHRESIDLDLFTNNQLVDMSEIDFAVDALVVKGGYTLHNKVQTNHYLKYLISDEKETTLKIDFVKDVPVHFGEITKQGVVRLDSLDNIGSNKITAILGRTEVKDFIDLFWILTKTAHTFPELFNYAQQKDLGLNKFYLANAFSQVEVFETLPVMLKQFSLEEMKVFFLGLSEQLFKEIEPN